MAEDQTPMSSALKLVPVPEKGRGFVATKPIQGGKVILRESPVLVFPAYPFRRPDDQDGSSQSSAHCAHCYRTLSTPNSVDSIQLLTCPSCCDPEDAARFCCAQCYSSACSTTHSPWVCAALNYLRNCSLLSEERQVQARYLVAAYNLAMVSPSDFQTLMSLHGNGERYMDVASSFHPIISALRFSEEFSEGFLDLSTEMIACLLDKEMNNSFNLMEPSRENEERGIRAYALYPNVSLFNHSCVPNACRFEYLDSGHIGNNTDIIIRTMRDVSEGEEICLSYVRVNRSYIDRKKRLWDYFGFTCLCERCKAEASEGSNWGELVQKFVCEKEKCGGTLAPLNPSEKGNLTDGMECNYCGSLTDREL